MSSRLNFQNKQEYIEEVWDDGFSSLGIDVNEPKQSKVVLWDADSVLHFVLYSGKDEFGNRNPEYIEADSEMLQGKLTEFVLKTLNSVEKYFNILSLYIFIKGKNNFRKELFPTYKANRPAPNPLISKLYEYFKIAHQAIEAENAEAEDYVYTLSKKIDNNGIILSIDHDNDEIPGIHYNYKTDKWRKITPEQARMSKIQKLIVSESGDNVNLAKGLGIKHFQKNYNSSMSDEEIEEQLMKSYTKVWKDENIAKEKLELAKQLLFLKEIK